MERWSVEEDEILVAFSNEGAAKVARHIRRETGRYRSPNAVRCRAHDIGISLAMYDVCPECRRSVRTGELVRATGMCRLCNEKHIAERSRRRREEAERPFTKAEEHLIEVYRRERAKERKAKQRVREKEQDLNDAVEWLAADDNLDFLDM